MMLKRYGLLIKDIKRIDYNCGKEMAKGMILHIDIPTLTFSTVSGAYEPGFVGCVDHDFLYTEVQAVIFEVLAVDLGFGGLFKQFVRNELGPPSSCTTYNRRDAAVTLIVLHTIELNSTHVMVAVV